MNESGGFDEENDTFLRRNLFANVTGNDGGNVAYVSTWIVILFLMVIFAGACTNAALVLALLRSRRNGLLTLILQLAFVDLITIYSASTEIWCIRENTWAFRPELCPLFLGMETLTNTSSLYLIICLNFHIISLSNLTKTEKLSRNPLTSCNEDNSNECLVTKADNPSSNKNTTVECRRKRNDLSVIFPTIFVWIISLSLSIPEFTLSSTLKISDSVTLCTIIDIYYGKLLQNLLLFFRVIIPVPLFLLFFLVILVRICCIKISRDKTEDVLAKKPFKIKTLLLFCLCLNALYLLTSCQRQFFYFYHVITQDHDKGSINNFKLPPLYNSLISNYISTFSSLLHYVSSLLRSLLYIFLLPKFKFLIKSKLCFMYKK